MPWRIRLSSIAMPVVLAVAGTVAGAADLDHIPLAWRPSKSLHGTAIRGPLRAVQFAPFMDDAPDPALIAENREQRLARPVTTSTNVGTFVSQQMRHLFDDAGFRTVGVDGSGALVISGEVTRFFVVETDRYRATVALHVIMRTPGGPTLWEGDVSGSGDTFGRSYKMKNYDQVLSDAIVDATGALINDADFLRALRR
jgi:hypothetical protein